METGTDGRTLDTVFDRLLCPFPPQAIRDRPGGRGRKLNYIEPEVIVRRLNQVVGPANWTTRYERMNGAGAATYKCSLTILGVTKEAVGAHVSAKKQNSSDDAMEPDDVEKSAQTDSFKRAAMVFGIGNFLNYLGDGAITWVNLREAAQKAGWQGELAPDAESAPQPQRRDTQQRPASAPRRDSTGDAAVAAQPVEPPANALDLPRFGPDDCGQCGEHLNRAQLVYCDQVLGGQRLCNQCRPKDNARANGRRTSRVN